MLGGEAQIILTATFIFFTIKKIFLLRQEGLVQLQNGCQGIDPATKRVTENGASYKVANE